MATSTVRKKNGTYLLILFVLIVGIATTFILKERYMQKPKEKENLSMTLAMPTFEGGKSLMQALKDRKTERDFKDQSLSFEHLSGLLWAATGINRPAEGRMTAPTARNLQNMQVYVILENGAYRYQPKEHMLVLVTKNDIRKEAGSQDYVWTAPVNIVIVADYTGMDPESLSRNHDMAMVNAGYISQNIYLYAAAFDLSTVARGLFDGRALSAALNLSPDQEVVFTQSVGYPVQN